MGLYNFKNSQSRILRYYDNQKKDCPIILFLHGFPGSYEQGLFIETSTSKIRLISIDRPGLGGSDYNPKSSLMAVAEDIRELMDSLEIEKFYLVGISGGGPYAMAVAALLNKRIIKTTLVCPLGPLYIKEVFSEMPKQSRELFKLHLKANYLTPIILTGFRKYFLKRTHHLFLKIQKKYSKVDQITLQQPHIFNTLVGSMVTAFSPGIDGLISDINNYLNNWNFEVREITHSVSVWHGDKDNIVPIKVGQWYSKNLLNVSFFTKTNHGHFSLPHDCLEEIIGDLLTPNFNPK